MMPGCLRKLLGSFIFLVALPASGCWIYYHVLFIGYAVRESWLERFCQLTSVDLSEFTGNSAKNCVTVKARHGEANGEVDAKMKPVEVSDMSSCGFDGKEKAEKVRRSIRGEKSGGFKCFANRRDPPELKVVQPGRDWVGTIFLCCLFVFYYCFFLGVLSGRAGSTASQAFRLFLRVRCSAGARKRKW